MFPGLELKARVNFNVGQKIVQARAFFVLIPGAVQRLDQVLEPLIVARFVPTENAQLERKEIRNAIDKRFRNTENTTED